MEIDIKNFEIKNTTKCNCGHEFTLKDVTDLRKIDEHGFYGNIVKNCSYTQCPNCYKNTLLLLRQRGQTWEILNIATQKEVKAEIEKEENMTEETTRPNETIQTSIQEFICPECKKTCKSQLGLNTHMKIHKN